MTRSAISLFVFGIYLLIAGALFVISPNSLLSLFGFPPTTEVFIRIVGMLMMFLGVYYLLASRHAWIDFFRWSIFLRVSVTLFFAAFVLLGYVRASLMIFAGIDFLGAIWTTWALNGERIQLFATKVM
jgi:hypothetical protein